MKNGILVVCGTLILVFLGMMAVQTGVISINGISAQQAAIVQPSEQIAEVAQVVQPVVPTAVMEPTPAPHLQVQQEPQAMVGSIDQQPVAGVENNLSGQVYAEQGNITVIMGGEPQSAANSAIEAAANSVVTPGDATAIVPMPQVADGSFNCQTTDAGHYVVIDPNDSGGIKATVNKGTRLYGPNGEAYEAPITCNVGQSAIQYCGEATHPESGVQTILVWLFDKVFGVPVAYEPVAGCPSQ